ncbi:MAG: PilZ domain-containing protein [Magnetococcales bacterium]|nr:PilZ domain-containing protein [Magnetococcales bacterium]
MPSSFGFSENRRDFFRNQTQMRFRWRLVGGLEFSFQKTFFAANGYLPPSRDEKQDSSPSWNLSYWEDPSLIDVSGGGCSFPLPAHLHKIADILEVQLAMEDGTLLCAIVDVVRRYYRDPHHWIGCRFLLISRKDQEKLIQYQTRVQRSALKKRLEEKLIEVPVVVEAKTVEEKQKEPEEVPTLLVTTPWATYGSVVSWYGWMILSPFCGR